MDKKHYYKSKIMWTGNRGEGTASYNSYDRSHIIAIKNKINIAGSSDTAFSGDPTKHNPEDLFLSSLSACHMLWYLHLCADNGIQVTSYSDEAEGTMLQTNAGGQFTEVILHPRVEINNKEMALKAMELHKEANMHCFIARSCNFPVKHFPEVF